MRSDNVKRHAQSHKDILAMNNDEVRDELRARHATDLHREERRQTIEEIAIQENIPISHVAASPATSTLDTLHLEVELLQDNQDYLDKMELGKQIAVIIDKGTVREESLTRIRKEALDLYRKQMPRIDVGMVQLRSWQQDLMQMIAKPSYREVF